MKNLKVWGEDMDYGTILQAEKTARLPILGGHVALMPDAHVGIGATVGSVIPTEGAIIPSAVGVDIGCGMVAVETDLHAYQLPDGLQPVVDAFSLSIPAGVGKGRDIQSTEGVNTETTRKAAMWLAAHPHDIPEGIKNVAHAQLGTLGSGNHFVEVCLDERDVVWVILHSGSRGIGNQLASRHIKLAKAQEQGLEDPDLSYFLEGTPKFDAYVSDMLWAQDYALENRELMMTAALSELFRFVGVGAEVQRINCHHNFAIKESHFGRDMWITRKGAIRARVGDLGVIPGSMGAKSYIVEGLGNPDSYTSSSHGAGRRMSRGQAKRELTTESLEKIMEGKAWNRNAESLLDEHPQAYKSIEAVMEAQADLTRVVHELHQIVNYKGM